MTAHRADPRVSVLPHRFTLRSLVPDLMNLAALLLGFTFALTIILWCMAAVLNTVGFAIIATLAWVASMALYIWMKDADARP